MLAIFYQISGSEVIEFSAEKLVIRKEVLGFPRTREYPIASCTELQAAAADHKDGLQCKLGWRTIHFGAGLDEDQAIRIIVELQHSLPEIADKIWAHTSSTRSHHTWLKLD